jgi:hypothetical protein
MLHPRVSIRAGLHYTDPVSRHIDRISLRRLETHIGSLIALPDLSNPELKQGSIYHRASQSDYDKLLHVVSPPHSAFTLFRRCEA